LSEDVLGSCLSKTARAAGEIIHAGPEKRWGTNIIQAHGWGPTGPTKFHRCQPLRDLMQKGGGGGLSRDWKRELGRKSGAALVEEKKRWSTVPKERTEGGSHTTIQSLIEEKK